MSKYNEKSKTIWLFLNSFNASSITVFLIKATGINHLHLLYDFRCIFTMVECFRSWAEMGFPTGAIVSHIETHYSTVESLTGQECEIPSEFS